MYKYEKDWSFNAWLQYWVAIEVLMQISDKITYKN